VFQSSAGAGVAAKSATAIAAGHSPDLTRIEASLPTGTWSRQSASMPFPSDSKSGRDLPPMKAPAAAIPGRMG
jgi:hypothetical protein